MPCKNPDDGTLHQIGDKVCHGDNVFQCTINGWVNTGAPCGGTEMLTVKKPRVMKPRATKPGAKKPKTSPRKP